jgi:hypothetical protein
MQPTDDVLYLSSPSGAPISEDGVAALDNIFEVET